jgi:hypothetical protein
MPAIPWFEPVKKRKTLEVFAGQSVSGSWKTAFDLAVNEFNNLSLGVRLVTGPNVQKPGAKNVSGADVWVEVGTQFTFESVGSGPLTVAVPTTTGAKGRTQPIGGANAIVKSFIVVMTVDNAPGQPYGPRYHACTLFHEFIHACGLDGNEHTLDDIFSSVLTPKSPGPTAQNDFAESITGRQMPPVFVGGKVRNLIQSNWQ